VLLFKKICYEDEYKFDENSINDVNLFVRLLSNHFLFKFSPKFIIMLLFTTVFFSSVFFNFTINCKKTYKTNWFLFNSNYELGMCQTYLEVIYNNKLIYR
jgi:hypothetical protein